jgi:predicted phosphodiesterase
MASKTIIQLSDLHVGLRRKENERTKLLFEHIARSYAGATVMITGDLTDSAETRQLKKTRELLDRLALTNPVLVVPGNHDYAWKGNLLRAKGWENWIMYLGSPLGWGRAEVPWMTVDYEPKGIDGLGVWKDRSCVYFGVDSGDPADRQISARGYISEKLAKALKDSLLKYTGKTRIVFLHHHPFTEGFFTRLHGSRRLLSSLNNNCELLLFGHNHEYGMWSDKHGVPKIVASQKSTDTVSGNCMMITIMDIRGAGSSKAVIRHRIEVVPAD